MIVQEILTPRFKLKETVDPVTGAGAVVPSSPVKPKSQPKVKPVTPAVKVDINKHKEDPAADTYKKPTKENNNFSVQIKSLVDAVTRLEAELRSNPTQFDREDYYRKKNLLRKYKKNIQNLIAQHGVAENFADGKGPGRPGDSQRHGIPKGATMAELEKAAHAKGRKGQLARWQLNMRRGKKK